VNVPPPRWFVEPFTTIEAVCDDPRHDGELGPVDTFARLTADGDWITAEQLVEKGPVKQTGWRDHTRDNHNGGPIHSYRCQLCPQRRKPQQFECSNDTLQWLLNTVADMGMSQPPVRFLNLLLSNRT
jgi:hypothetical protein